MREYPLNPKIKDMWKSFPIRIPGGTMSSCFNEPTILVQSRPGGFVTCNCSKCNEKELLSEQSFRNLDIWVACPKCKQRMKAQKVVHSNYGYECRACQLYIRLADLLPMWKDIE